MTVEQIISINKHNQIKSNKIYLICVYGFGDTLLVCGFQEAIKEQYGADVHFIIKREHEILMKLYGITDYSCKYFEDKELKNIAKDNREIKSGFEFVAHPMFLNDNEKLLNSYLKNEISQEELFRKTLGLRDDVLFQPPKIIPQINQELQNKLNKIAPLDKIVIFSPESFSTKRINHFDLENMAKHLKDDGFVVISSVLDKNEIINGTIYVDLSFEEALAVSINCAEVFTVRSGFTDVLNQYRKDITVIYPDLETFKLCTLNRNKNNDAVIEIFASKVFVKKMGPIFQIEDKGNEQLYRFCLTFLRKKRKRELIKYCVLGIPIWIIKIQANYRKHYLLGCICVFKEIVK